MKRILVYFYFLIMFIFFIPKVYALSVDKNELTIEKGKNSNINLYANTEATITGVDFTFVYSTYDIPANFNAAAGITDTMANGIKHSLKFSEGETGKIFLGTITVNALSSGKDTVGTINIHTVKGITANGDEVNLDSQAINVKVTEEAVNKPEEEVKKVEEEPKKEINKNLLTKIDSKIVKITLKKDVFEYDVEVDNDVKELDLKPVGLDDDVKVGIDSQKIAELKDKKLLIKATKDDTEVTYTINVSVKDKENKNKMMKIAIDDTVFVDDNSYKHKWLIVSIGLFVALILALLFGKSNNHRKRRKKIKEKVN